MAANFFDQTKKFVGEYLGWTVDPRYIPLASLAGIAFAQIANALAETDPVARSVSAVWHHFIEIIEALPSNPWFHMWLVVYVIWSFIWFKRRRENLIADEAEKTRQLQKRLAAPVLAIEERGVFIRDAARLLAHIEALENHKAAMLADFQQWRQGEHQVPNGFAGPSFANQYQRLRYAGGFHGFNVPEWNPQYATQQPALTIEQGVTRPRYYYHADKKENAGFIQTVDDNFSVVQTRIYELRALYNERLEVIKRCDDDIAKLVIPHAF